MADSLHAMLSAFQRLNESWPKTCVIMTDKDMTERRTLSELFPDATLQLCLFHTLRSFKREFSMEKMGLCPGMRDNSTKHPSRHGPCQIIGCLRRAVFDATKPAVAACHRVL